MTSDATHGAHGTHGVHGTVEASPIGAPPDEHAAIYETAGISEGHAPVPRWMLLVILALFSFFGWYIATHWGAQASTAQNKQ